MRKVNTILMSPGGTAETLLICLLINSNEYD